MITEAQRIERRQGIGGSDAAAVLGMNPWATPLTVWLDKTGRTAPKPETPQMRYGSYFEDYVAKLYCEEAGRVVENYRKMLHKGCLLGNIDRLVVPIGGKIASYKGEIRTDTLLECKTSGFDWGDEAPMQYIIQVVHYMGLDEKLKHADIAVLFRSSLNFKIYRIERDDDIISAMQQRLVEWWDKHVIRGEMPLPSNESDCRLLWARSNPGKKVSSNEEVERKIADYAELKAMERDAKAKAALLQSDICAYMGDGEILVDASGKPLVTWKSPKDTETVDWEGLAKALGATDEQVAAYTSVKTSNRRFLLKKVEAA